MSYTFPNPKVEFPRYAPFDETAKPRIHGLHIHEIKILSDHCRIVKDDAYCPYSSFRVGATLLTKSNHLISGANIENAAYPSGSCAERVALGTAITLARCRLGSFKALGVCTDLKAAEGAGEEAYASPCGFCRQALREFCEPEVPVFMFDIEGKYMVKTIGELLPMSFGPDKLPPPQNVPAH